MEVEIEVSGVVYRHHLYKGLIISNIIEMINLRIGGLGGPESEQVGKQGESYSVKEEDGALRAPRSRPLLPHPRAHSPRERSRCAVHRLYTEHNESGVR